MDLLIGLDASGVPDFVFEGGDLKLDHGLRTPALVTLFTDGLVEPERARQGYRGGWCGAPNRAWGSRLWLLDRARADSQAPGFARQAAADALNWMLNLGAAASIEVEADYFAPGQLGFTVRLRDGEAARWSGLDSLSYDDLVFPVLRIIRH